jgi:tRNA threonylcarbamoyladenosine biosynthesis protein TsaB
MMKDLSVSFAELSALAVSCGPGSFTGLRIGMSTAKALAHANTLPLYSASSLLVLAFNARLSSFDVCPMLDARKGEVYTAVYRFEKSGYMEKLEPTVLSPEKLADILPDKVVLIGEGIVGYRDILEKDKDPYCLVAPPSLSLPRASHLAALVHSGMVNESVGDVMSLEPLYIRRPEAEIKWRGKGRKAK